MAGRKKKVELKVEEEIPQDIGREEGFDPSSIPDFSDGIKEALLAMQDRRKNRTTGFKTAAEVTRSMIPIRDFRLQYLLGCKGLPHGTCIEIIGGENIGKSTLTYWLAGGAIMAGGHVAIQESEGKALSPDWALRALHSNPEVAKKMLNQITVFENVFSLDQMEENMLDWFKVMREEIGVPMHLPLLMIVDSWSKLMSVAESEGYFDWGDKLDTAGKKAFKGTAEGSNFGHSKWAHAFCRRLPYTLTHYNAVLLNVCHQNDKVSMSMGGGGFSIPEDAKNMFNKTKIGGRAFNQNSSIQLILGYKGAVKNSDNKSVGQKVAIRCDKNSYGPKNRVVEYELHDQDFNDTEGYLDPSIRFHKDLANWMTTEKLLGTTASRARYTSDAVGVINATAEDFSVAFHANQELVNELGIELGIQGYSNILESINEQPEKDE